MLTRLLTKQEYLATCPGKMTDVTKLGDAVVDIWPYVNEAKRGLDISDHAVKHELVEIIYRTDDGRFDHVLIPYGVDNVFLTVVVDRLGRGVHGHYLLDLNEEYGVGYAKTERGVAADAGAAPACFRFVSGPARLQFALAIYTP